MSHCLSRYSCALSANAPTENCARVIRSALTRIDCQAALLLLGTPFFRFHLVGNMPSVTLASVMTSMMCSTCARREAHTQNGEKGTYSLKVLFPSGEVSKVLVLELATECLRPEYHTSHPPLFRLSTEWG